MRDRFIAAIDLGSSAIRLAVGQVTVGSDRREVLSMIGADEVISSGISKGAVQSLDDVTSAVSAVLDRVERSIGIPVTEVYVGVGGSQIQVKPTRGVVGISNPDGIREEDYRRVLEHAAQSSHSANYEVLHRLPQRFSIDGQQAIKDPVGMQGARLEAEVCVIQGLVGHVRNITQSVMRTNVDVTGLVFSPLATAEAYLTPRQRDLGSALVNIGATTTSLAVFEDGDLLHAVILPIGSDHVTRDIALGLQTSLEVAEQCKWHYVHGVSENMSQTEAIDLQELGAPESEFAYPRYISDIAVARLEEIFEKIEEELQKIGRSGMLSAGVVLTGGGAKTRGIVDVAKRVLRLPAIVAGGSSIQTPLVEIAKDPAYATVIGLLQYGYEDQRGVQGVRSSAVASGDKFLQKMGGPLKKIFKSFIP